MEVARFQSDEKREAIAELCRAYGVERLDLFGSAATDAFRPGASDVDLLVDFGDMGGRAKAHALFDLQDGLSEGLGGDVDLVMVGTGTLPAPSSSPDSRCMPRSVAAYLVDVLEACDGIESVLEDVDLVAYRNRRAKRSSVERAFILIGEVVASLGAWRPSWRLAARTASSSASAMC